MQYQHSELKNMILQYASNSLDREDREAIELHLASCKECRAELFEAQEMNTLLDGLSLEPPEELKNGVMAKIKAEKRQMLIKRLTRIALPAAMLALVISVSLAYPLMFENKQNDLSSADRTEIGSNSLQDAEPEQSVFDKNDFEQVTSPDIFFFFSSEGYLQGSEKTELDDNEGASSVPSDPSLSPADSEAEDSADMELPDGIGGEIPDKFRMQIKLVRSYIFLKSLPDTVGEPILVYQYEGYMVYIYDADDGTLPGNMEKLYSNGDFSLIIVG